MSTDTPTLVIGNKKYSSWSLRPWLLMRVKDIPFIEKLSRFDHSTTPYHVHFYEFSASKKVPVLIHGATTIWDSLAIMEYLAELYPDRGLWPATQRVRAHARSIANEMHSGFFALRDECPMNMKRPSSAINLSDAAVFDIQRVEAIWEDCYGQYGGPFLFGDFSIADAMFAPVVNRFEVYQLGSTGAADRFSDAIRSLAPWQEWASDGANEPWVCEIAEVPVVDTLTQS